MEQNSNQSEQEKKIEKVNESIKKMEKLVESSRSMKILLEDKNFKTAIINNFFKAGKEVSINRLINEPFMDVETETKLLAEVRVLKKMEDYIRATADNLENRQSALAKEKAFKVELIKTKNQQGEK